MSNKPELRDIPAGLAELRADGGRTVSGYAALYNSESEDLGGFREVIAPGAFRSVLQKSPDVILNFNHDANYILGRTSAGTLQLREDSRGLHFEADLADTQLIKDVVLSPMQRGELSAMSFAFMVDRNGQTWDTDATGSRKRTITNFAGLMDVSIVATPAYSGTSVSARSAREILAEDAPSFADYRIDLYRRRLQLVGAGLPDSQDYRIDLYRRKLQLLSL